MSVPLIIPPSPPLPADAATMRLGTFNLGLGFMRKLPHIVSRCAALELDAVALQEIGNPALLSTRLPPYTFIYEPGRSQHEGGVGLLLSSALASRIRCYHRSDTGRLVGAVLELSKGQLTLLISAYMPTGIDHSAASSPARKQAAQLYAMLSRWSVGMHQVIIMGDLNETLTHWDRFPQPPALAAEAARVQLSPISQLQQEGFTDAYRVLYPSAALTPGFTHAIPSRHLQSRIDYVWLKGINDAALLRVEIDAALHTLSHHHLLWVEVQLTHAGPVACSTPLLRLQLPNLRAATEQHKDQFIERLQHRLLPGQQALQQLATSGDPHSLNRLATSLTKLTRHAAFASLPITGSASYKSSDMLQLQKQRHALSILIRISSSLLALQLPGSHLAHSLRFTDSREWNQQYRLCVGQLQLRWILDAQDNADPHAWLLETHQLRTLTRTAIRKEQQRMQRGARAPIDASPAAIVHRMLQGDALPTHLHSVVDKHGSLTTSASELEAVMVDHFQSVFALPPDPVAPLLPSPAMLFDKESVQPEWYDGLMDPVTPAELLATLTDAPLVSAPGEDDVSVGLWAIALRRSSELCALTADLFSGCLRSGSFPCAWKTSIIVPLLKDASKERSMNNVRPISLQSCLGKLLNKLLAHRLGIIFSRNPILHPAQRGFVHGGSITKSIDELLDAWDWSRVGGHEMYTLFYDIKQAYDSVQVDVLVRAMHRLRMPAVFITLIEDSLVGLQSCVRTAYGVSPLFEVQRSLRQGDPLAPLLFVVLMDALHDGLECNPFTGERHGLVLAGLGGARTHGAVPCIPSLGYADDTAVLSNTLASMRVQNDWVHYFMAFNKMLLNHRKCELVGRTAANQSVSAVELAAENITIEGHPLTPLPHDHPIRYLGVHCRMDGSWQSQHVKSLAMIRVFTGVVDKFSLTLNHAAFMFNVFLLPKLELALRYVHGPNTARFISNCDAAIVGCIKHAAASPLRLSHSQVALTLGITLPSWIETTAKVSELFLRINSTELNCRWAELGRLLLHQVLPCGLVAAESRPALPWLNAGSRMTRTVRLASSELQWVLKLHAPRSAITRVRSQHLFDLEPIGALPDGNLCSLSQELQLASGSLKVAHDVWRGWGASAPAPPSCVHVYTDGSYDANSSPSSTSSWAITVGDRWLDHNFARMPADEKKLKATHVKGHHSATMFGASISCTRGVYAAELQAIARALAMFPLSCELEIHSDSQGALAGIRAYESQSNHRRRLRMASRPLLQLIHHLLQRRRADTHTSHVKAHTTNTDIHSVGNRLTDYQANLARVKPGQPAPLCLRELPLQDCEHHMFILDEQGELLCDDVRRAALSQLKKNALKKWSTRSDGRGDLAGPEMIQLGQHVLRHGAAPLQTALVHVATNSIDFFWPPGGVGSGVLQRLQCEQCDAFLSIMHLVECPEPFSVQFRSRLANDVRAALRIEPVTSPWLLAHSNCSLVELLVDLFPITPTASAQERLRHLSRMLVGAFTCRQANTASKHVGFASADDGRATFLRIQLLCLDHIEIAYRNWKAAA